MDVAVLASRRAGALYRISAPGFRLHSGLPPILGCMLGLPPAVAFNSEEDILQLSALEIDFHIVLD